MVKEDEWYAIDSALFCVQASLLGAVTPNLRAVVFDLYDDKRCLFLRFYYDGDPSEEVIEGWRCAVTEASASMQRDCDADDQIERLDAPAPIPFLGPSPGGGYLAFLRKEPGSAHVDPSRMCHLSWTEEYRAFPEAYALVVANNVLLGKISPELRKVIVQVPPNSKVLNVRFFYDGLVSEETLELWEKAALEIGACMGGDYSCHPTIERIDFPEKLPTGTWRVAYWRREPVIQTEELF